MVTWGRKNGSIRALVAERVKEKQGSGLFYHFERKRYRAGGADQLTILAPVAVSLHIHLDPFIDDSKSAMRAH